MGQVYLVRYGLMGGVGRFEAEGDGLERGQEVVIRTARGTELGMVLVPEAGDRSSAGPEPWPILRAAGADDLERARALERDRPGRLAACEAVLRVGDWPLDLIDVEPLLDEGRAVLHYLGPRHLEADALRHALREAAGLDVTLEPVGRVEPEGEPAATGGCGSCSSASGCGAGGCGSGGGCSGCAVKDLVRRRQPAAV